MNKEVKTVIGELTDRFGGSFVIGDGGEEVWLTEEQFEAVKLPELDEYERKYYDEIRESEKGDKRKMVSDVVADVTNGDCVFASGGYYRIIEAIIKGGYNH